jgi:dephospho-CoA kinase
VVFESATVLEKPQFEGFGDKIVLVDAPFETRLERACRRDGTDREKVLARMHNQKLMNELSAGGEDPRIDCRIVNDCSIDDLVCRTKIAINSLIS